MRGDGRTRPHQISNRIGYPDHSVHRIQSKDWREKGQRDRHPRICHETDRDESDCQYDPRDVGSKMSFETWPYPLKAIISSIWQTCHVSGTSKFVRFPKDISHATGDLSQIVPSPIQQDCRSPPDQEKGALRQKPGASKALEEYREKGSGPRLMSTGLQREIQTLTITLPLPFLSHNAPFISFCHLFGLHPDLFPQ